MSEKVKKFASPEEEIHHWRVIAEDYKRSLAEVKQEFEEYQIDSKELEAELDTQLQHAEKKNNELLSSNSRLQRDLADLREKFEENQQLSHQQTTELQDELAQVKAQCTELQRYIRELEQANDDLERTKRQTVVSLDDFEQRLNQAIERNAFLESELEERETLAVTVQRLKDEARDLRNELVVTKKKDDDVATPTPDSQSRTDGAIATHPKLAVHEELGASLRTPRSHSRLVNGSPFTPSARISALNIVGDLLKKVSNLESKLASCKNLGLNSPFQPNEHRVSVISPLGSPRAKRLHRGLTDSSTLTPASSVNISSQCVKNIV